MRGKIGESNKFYIRNIYFDSVWTVTKKLVRYKID